MPDRTKDELLLVKAGAGDSAAFLQVYERHRDAVFRFAYRLSGSVELAEDITHDSFLGLLRKPGNFVASRASLRTYLFAAVRNLWFKQLRIVGRESPLDDLPEDQFIATGREPLARLMDGELSLKVKEAVWDLPPLQREALILFDYEGLALSEIASLVGTDVGAVKARLHRARTRLRNTLQPYLNSSREIVTLET
ncbi:MAG TPA: RNA polymerase sigma factor [Pyrinomonadaceae bacterium]|nr:RNA polymerase sigma factor [Pyrinomonadaceae bacterium]